MSGKEDTDIDTPTLIHALSSGAAIFTDLLNSGLLVECIDQVNNTFAPRHLIKLPTELLPTRQRNLTDTRTRIGILLEYFFALALHHAIEAREVDRFRVSFVVANRYPDLYIRDSHGLPIIRIEIKTLDLTSEEKSANFDAQIRDIHPHRDILLVLLWAWDVLSIDGVMHDIPKVTKAYAFEARPIAQARDLGWLRLRTRQMSKAIDLAGPVVGRDGYFREEEGNVGKLMRILDNQSFAALPEVLTREPSIKLYREFVVAAKSLGLIYRAGSISQLTGVEFTPVDDFAHSTFQIKTLGYGDVIESDEKLVLATGAAMTAAMRDAYHRQLLRDGISQALVIVYTEKFNWFAYMMTDNSLTRVGEGKKLDTSIAYIRNHFKC